MGVLFYMVFVYFFKCKIFIGEEEWKSGRKGIFLVVFYII